MGISSRGKGSCPTFSHPRVPRPRWSPHWSLMPGQNTRALLSVVLVAPLHSPLTVPKGGGPPGCPHHPSPGSTQLQRGCAAPHPCSPMGGINPSGSSWSSGPGHPTGPPCCPQVPKPSLGPVPAHGAAAAAARPHLGLIFHVKPHWPLGCRSRWRKSPRERREEPEGWLRMWSLDQGDSGSWGVGGAEG